MVKIAGGGGGKNHDTRCYTCFVKPVWQVGKKKKASKVHSEEQK